MGDLCRATQCNFCRAEVATSCDFIAILVQFVSAKRQYTTKVTMLRELHLKPRR